MNKKLIIIVLIALAVLVLAYWQGYLKYGGYKTGEVSAPQTQTPNPTQPVGAVGRTYMIKITNIGFSPNTLDIRSGDTVKFVNQNSNSHWPASDPHPTHTLCPGFDAYHGLVYNEEYSYTFNFAAPRICTYHDHFNPAIKGVINIVQ